MSIEIIYFVHGTTFDNANSKCSGWKQVNLNEQGKEQAKRLGEITNYKFDALFTSDLVRAVDSANLAWPNLKKIQDKRLRECNYGDFDGKDKSLVKYEIKSILFEKNLEILSNLLQIKSYEILVNDFNNTDLMKYLKHQDDLLSKIIEQNEQILKTLKGGK